MITNMSRECALCGKTSRKSISRSHSNIKTIRRLHPNLQSKKIDGKKEKVCTTCIRTIKRNEKNTK